MSNPVIVKSISQYESYLRKIGELKKTETLKKKQRQPLGKAWLKSYFWGMEMPASEIAKMINVSESWVRSEIDRLGLGKKENSVRFRGKKGYAMPWSEKLKHHRQPHAVRIAKVDAVTGERIEIYLSVKAAARDGFRAERIRNAIQTHGLHRGYKWERV